jgi:NMD protein affecting ribosome stability and mRNA decay
VYLYCENIFISDATINGMHSSYFEAILQLRNPNDSVPVIIDAFLRRHSRLKITKEVQRKDGVDLYLTSQHDAQRLGNALKNLGAEVTVSERIFSKDRMSSKEIFRVTILARFPLFSAGDVVECQGKLMQVTSMGKRLCGNDLQTGKRLCLKGDAILQKKEKTRVIAIRPEITILDPETYQPATASARQLLHVGENVVVVRWNGQYYCV